MRFSQSTPILLVKAGYMAMMVRDAIVATAKKALL